MSDDNRSFKTNGDNPTFSQIKSDLSSALSQWDQISASAPAISKDQEQLLEMQRLLKELHAKMKALKLG